MEQIKQNAERRYFAFAAGNPLTEARDTILRIVPILPDTAVFERFTCEPRVREYLARHDLLLAAGPLYVVPGRERVVAADVNVEEEERGHCPCMEKARSRSAMRLGEISEREVQHYVVTPAECEPRAIVEGEGVHWPLNLGAREQRQFILSAPILRDRHAHAVRVDHYVRHQDHEHYIGGFNVLFVPEHVKAQEHAARDNIARAVKEGG